MGDCVHRLDRFIVQCHSPKKTNRRKRWIPCIMVVNDSNENKATIYYFIVVEKVLGENIPYFTLYERLKLPKLHVWSKITQLIWQTNYIQYPFLIEALLILIKTVHVSSLNWLPLHKIILHIQCTVSKFTDLYFTKRAVVQYTF